MIEETRLDGNAAGGTLQELFVRDITTAVATCGGCGRAAPVGALLEYGHGMGIVLRCGSCDAVMLRFVRAPRALHVDASGMSMLVIPQS